jgi:hypothetical protein
MVMAVVKGKLNKQGIKSEKLTMLSSTFALCTHYIIIFAFHSSEGDFSFISFSALSSLLAL